MGRLVYQPGNRAFRSPASAIEVLRLGCEEDVLRERLDRFPPHLRIHGGYRPFIGEMATRITVTWDPQAVVATFVQRRDGAEGDTMNGNVDVPAGVALNDILMNLLVPDAEDVVDQAREAGKPATMKDVDFWIGDRHFKI